MLIPHTSSNGSRSSTWTARHHGTRPTLFQDYVGNSLLALFVIFSGIAIFRVTFTQADDPVIAFLATVFAFLATASLFAGEHKRRR